MKTIPMWETIPGPTNGVQPALEYYAPASPAKDAAVVNAYEELTDTDLAQSLRRN